MFWATAIGTDALVLVKKNSVLGGGKKKKETLDVKLAVREYLINQAFS